MANNTEYVKQVNDKEVSVELEDKLLQDINRRIAHHLLPVTIVIGTEALIGLVGNILILIVYCKFYKHCNFRYCVLFLAVYDLTSCLITLPGEMYLQLNWFSFRNDSLCKLKSYFNVFTAWGSAFTLCLLACDRYRQVCKPLATQLRPTMAFKLCSTGVILSFCISVPDAVLWGTQTFTYDKGNDTLHLSICEKANKYKDTIYPFVYIISVYIIPLGIIVVVICTVNMLIARKMYFKRTLTPFVHRLSSSSRQQNNRQDFSLFQHINRLLFNTSYHTSSRTTCNDNVRVSTRRSEAISVTLSSISIESISTRPRSNGDVTSTSSIETTVQEINMESCKTGSGRGLNRNVAGSSVSSRTRRITEGSNDVELRMKKKTLIMLILTSVFVLTITVYVAMISVVAGTRGKLDVMRQLENPDMVTFLFFLRLYFVNSVINPILYGLLDIRFRTGLKRLFCSRSTSR